jgi:hypothetical protein
MDLGESSEAFTLSFRKVTRAISFVVNYYKRYTIPQDANAQIMIYDASGKLVKTERATQSGSNTN